MAGLADAIARVSEGGQRDLALRTLSLFAGYGGLDLGWSIATGSRTVCYVEGEAYAASILAARMEAGQLDPAPIWSDVRTFDPEPWRGLVDCVIGGFPCQDLSAAGKRAGIDGERSGLWADMARLIRALRPRYVFAENVSGLLANAGMRRVLGDLSAMGFDAEWGSLRAQDVGASHRRERVFVLAYDDSAGRGEQRPEKALGYHADSGREGMGDAECAGPQGRLQRRGDDQARRQEPRERFAAADGRAIFAPGPDDPAWAAILEQRPDLAPALPRRTAEASPAESEFFRVADGTAAAMDERTHRLRAIGNGVVPLQAACIARVLLNRIGR